MVGPQSLLSRANSSSSAIGEMETWRRRAGGGAPLTGGTGAIFGAPYFSLLPPRFLSLLSLQCKAGQGGGAVVRDSNKAKTVSGRQLSNGDK